MSIMGAIMAAVAGVLAVSAWQNAFFTYWISVPVLIMLIVFLPQTSAKSYRSKERKQARARAQGLVG